MSVIILDDIDFFDLIKKIEAAFVACLVVEDRKGRYFAEWHGHEFSIKVIDRIDRLGKFLCDENHVIDICVESGSKLCAEFEDEVRLILKNGEISWRRAVWSRANRFEGLREIYPDLD
ncbi:hypothetical protein [Burkholderia sp. Bp8998]|uniref:hypothetical protein n=1 Tax=Burkholderia sp. Bp8998 TaxID=2184557 RepID=UPI000F5B01D4|nr:hypothetical protein [Burkholderia sp. Bp8998]